MQDNIKRYYSRKDIQKEILESAKDREVAIKFGEKGYGKRPDILQYEKDISELANQGATSFHISEERWQDPMLLSTTLSKNQLDDLRIGWDLMIDVDTDFLEFSKIATSIIIDALKFHDINSFGVKFSGNKGFHILVPFESFPKTIDNKETRFLFPEGPRIIVNHIKDMIKNPLSKKILEISSIEEMSKSLKKDQKELKQDNKFNPFSVVNIDTVLISSRHLFRSPYSINEKSGLVSIPIRPENILNFKPSIAKIENVETEVEFFNTPNEEEAAQLIMQAFDFYKKKEVREEKQNNFKIVDQKIKTKEENFPPCIKLILKGMPSDGRKRALFVLINFLKNSGYNFDEIEKILFEWNNKNYEKLGNSYIKSQLSWHKRQKQSILPPNCKQYYIDIAVCNPDFYCSKIKNPVNYGKVKISLLKKK